MSYTIRIRDGGSWLDLLDEKGDVAQFDRFAEAVIKIKELFAAGGITEAEVRRAGSVWRFTRAPNGELQYRLV